MAMMMQQMELQFTEGEETPESPTMVDPVWGKLDLGGAKPRPHQV